jgi:F420H(2)-dependent quinone reductase
MNGWEKGHPAWWLNLKATPDAVVRLAGQPPRPVHAAAAEDVRDPLWQQCLALRPQIGIAT